MKLFELNRVTYEIEIAPEALMLSPLSKIVSRDKSKDKSTAKNELALIYHYCDVRSDYTGVSDDVKLEQIIENLSLPKNYKLDKEMKEAIEFYKKYSVTVIQELYEGALISAKAVNEYLRDTTKLLKDGDVDISKITASLEKLPKIMANLKAAEKELIKEKKDTEGRMKGSRKMNMFEDGLKKS